MPKDRETLYLGNDNAIFRQIIENGAMPIADRSTITKVEVILIKGSIRQAFNSADNPLVVEKPDVNWTVKLSFGQEAIKPGRYVVSLILFDSVNDDGIVVEPFHLLVKSV